jgi:hypothetical protein
MPPTADARAVMARLEQMRWSKVASASITAHIAQLGDDPTISTLAS